VDEAFEKIEELVSKMEEQSKELEVANFMLGVEIDELTKQVDTFLGRFSE